MLTVTTKGRYGTRVMLQLARCYGNGPLLLKTIAEKEEISKGYLEQILPMLKTAKLVQSSRGANGGYHLAKPPHKINLKEIVEALEGPITVVDCVDNANICKRHKGCTARVVWKKLKKNMAQTLEQLTLKCLIEHENS